MAEQQLTTRDLAGKAEAEPSEQQPAQQEPLGNPTTGDEPLAGDQPSSAGDEQTGSRNEHTPVPNDLEPDPAQRAQAKPLLPVDQGERFTARWQEIQASFVDQPRESVEQADALVADLMQRLAAGFSNEREHLERQWDNGDDVSTEDLRVALTRYRTFFDRLLTA